MKERNAKTVPLNINNATMIYVYFRIIFGPWPASFHARHVNLVLASSRNFRQTDVRTTVIIRLLQTRMKEYLILALVIFAKKETWLSNLMGEPVALPIGRKSLRAKAPKLESLNI